LATGQRLARELPNATLKVFDRCGHAPNEERPKETAAALTDFFLADAG
jgi:pimeloyl-ACP methyl ester carboxylesterase